MHGHQIFRDILPKNLIKEAKIFLEKSIDHKFVKISKGNSYNFASMTDDRRKLLTGHFPPEIRLSNTILELGKCESLHNLIKAQTGWSNINLHLPPMARFVVPGNTNAKVPIHQDIVYNRHLRDFVTVWIPLVEITDKCGGVRIADDPGVIIDDVEMGPNNVWLKEIDSNNKLFKDCVPMFPGDVLMFSKTTVHGSMENLSDKIRYSLDLRFFPAEVSSDKHFLNLATGEVHEPRTNVGL